ncbi:MAG: CDC48 family AAA ATPase [Nitrosopumilus sp.]|nr:CDC48 family AAA ATPase [Nitrosopumilus sp.]CAI9831145.1 Cell division cycle protein 48 homolog AF_1297 [Nitrosopumilaceae archaeon]MDA7941235.1 CDC48 family AAA ATPase [Nitrosopumilus sp.]MDA7942645.1 CDC48 family AAA ATPase [Nitrosopumilus sp.]MDA7945211.1 CDC48 family AAA ATPase [Nitrosopumilus sp.]
MARGIGALQVRVGEAKQRDVGKKRARVGPGIMDALKASPGDIVEISGSGTSCAVLWPADEDEKHQDVVRIDGQTRKNAGAQLGDVVRARRVQARPARSVSLAPSGGPAHTDNEFTEFVKGRLRGLPLVQGDEISVTILARPMDFVVSKVSPAGAVRIERSTQVAITEGGGGPGRPRATYEEVGGLAKEVGAMREVVELPLRHPELFQRLGIEPHGGILLYGPPGCGKTLLARVLASESEARIFLVNGPEIMNKYYGESEARMREIFKEAREHAPSIIFIDEMDAIAPRRGDAYGEVEKRVVAQLLALMDGLDDRGGVVVLGATNRPEGVDPALRRPGRFDREFEISVPNADGRLEILQIHARGMPVASSVDLQELAAELHGYTGADIKSLCREAALKAIRRYLPEIDLETERIPSGVLQSMEIKAVDFYEAMRVIVPTAMREFYVERPRVMWKDVGGLAGAKKTLSDNLAAAVSDPDRFSRMGVRAPGGALIYGPPGCGKTLLARALAAETGANMILVRGPEVFSRWTGESEKAVREIFKKAKSSAPCVVILDEVDSLARGRTGEGGAAESVLSQLLTEIEGAPAGVAVVGVTSRPDMLDGSLLRTGRLDLAVYAEPPDEQGRLEIIRILAGGMPLEDVDLREIAVATKNYTGADLAALCREAAVGAIGRGSAMVSSADFDGALGRVRPSITREVDRWYSSVREGISNAIPRSEAFYG